jgi:hypothetical protein
LFGGGFPAGLNPFPDIRLRVDPHSIDELQSFSAVQQNRLVAGFYRTVWFSQQLLDLAYSLAEKKHRVFGNRGGLSRIIRLLLRMARIASAQEDREQSERWNNCRNGVFHRAEFKGSTGSPEVKSRTAEQEYLIRRASKV